jgi:hypothetical protein
VAGVFTARTSQSLRQHYGLFTITHHAGLMNAAYFRLPYRQQWRDWTLKLIFVNLGFYVTLTQKKPLVIKVYVIVYDQKKYDFVLRIKKTTETSGDRPSYECQ